MASKGQSLRRADGFKHHTDFICTCDKKGQTRAAKLMAEVKERLSQGSPNHYAREVSDDHLLDAIVYSLNWDYGGHIDGIFNDQLSAISAGATEAATTPDGDHVYEDGKMVFEETFRTYIECDEVIHGIAATWKAFADNLEAQER